MRLAPEPVVLSRVQHRKLGNTGLEPSAIGFGCWEMGNSEYGQSDDTEMIAAVNRAIDLGVTLFDTAPNYGYGGSEEVLGRALGARRKDIILVSKVGIPWDPVTHTTKFGGRYSTLKRLGEARKHAPITANQVGYNLFDRRWEHEMFQTAQELDIGIMAYGPMAHGLLTGTLARQNAFDDRDWRRHGVIFGQRLFGPNLEHNLNVTDALLGVADRIGTSLPLLALAWVLRHPAVSVALSGCRTPKEIEENVRALDVTLDDQVLAEIDQIMSGAAGQTDVVPGRHHTPVAV